jgi:hypothetical protein
VFFKKFFFEISSIHSFSEIRLYRTKFWVYFESQIVVSQKLLFCFRKKDIWELQTYKHVNSIPALHKQYDIKMIVILQHCPKFIAQTLNSFFSKLVNNEIPLYRTHPTIYIRTEVKNECVCKILYPFFHYLFKFLLLQISRILFF